MCLFLCLSDISSPYNGHPNHGFGIERWQKSRSGNVHNMDKQRYFKCIDTVRLYSNPTFYAASCLDCNEKTTNRPSFLSTIDAERKDERTKDRPSFLSANNAERQKERTTNRPSFFSAFGAERREVRTTSRRSFLHSSVA